MRRSWVLMLMVLVILVLAAYGVYSGGHCWPPEGSCP